MTNRKAMQNLIQRRRADTLSRALPFVVIAFVLLVGFPALIYLSHHDDKTLAAIVSGCSLALASLYAVVRGGRS
jgi:hypothetical protein